MLLRCAEHWKVQREGTGVGRQLRQIIRQPGASWSLLELERVRDPYKCTIYLRTSLPRQVAY